MSKPAVQYRILDTVRDYRVQKLCPKLKWKSRWFWFGNSFYDYTDMVWVTLDAYGRARQGSVIPGTYDIGPDPKTFATKREASAFLKRVIKVRGELTHE
jgi:hypothetical protein